MKLTEQGERPSELMGQEELASLGLREEEREALLWGEGSSEESSDRERVLRGTAGEASPALEQPGCPAL